jgi:hypothetical protein
MMRKLQARKNAPAFPQRSTHTAPDSVTSAQPDVTLRGQTQTIPAAATGHRIEQFSMQPSLPVQTKRPGSLQGRVRENALPVASLPPPDPSGLPEELKAGVQALSGVALDNVRIHYNSSEPAAVNALAYTKGSNIFVGPGQEKYVPHEAWHVVQQAQGRVHPTIQLKTGVSVNDDKGLEHEADVMGAEAITIGHSIPPALLSEDRAAPDQPHLSGDIIQRVIAAPAFNPSADAAEQARLQALTTGVTNYNALDQVSNAAPDLQARFTQVTQLERLIYAWYQAKQVPDLADNLDPALGGNANEMRTLLRNAESERDTVVGSLQASGASITFDGAAPTDIANLQALWNAIINQTGNLRAIGQPVEINRLFSRIAAALQTGTGRNILDYMVNRSPNTVTMLFSTQINLQQIATASGASANDQANLLTNQDTSFAGQNDLQSTSQIVRDTSGLAATPLTTPAALINDITGAHPSAGYSANGATYRPGTGHAAFAAVKDAPVLDANRQKASSAAGNEVLTPTFITLMHELGHALKMASGTYMPTNQMFNPEITDHFLPTAADKDQWPASGLEEIVNVMGVENPIRAESGVSTRDSYETPEKVKMIQARQNAEQAWITLRNADAQDARIYLEEVQKRCDRQTVGAFQAINIFGAQTAADVANRIAPIQHLLMIGNQLINKRNYIMNAQAAFRAFLMHLAQDDRTRIQRTQRYQNLDQRFTNLLTNNQVALGQPQCDVQAQVDKFIADRAQLIAAGKKIKSVAKHGLTSPKNWGPDGRQVNEGQP